MNKRFIVTGGCGFIGSHLAEYLVKAGHHVVVIDDLSSGYKSNIESSVAIDHFINERVEDVELGALGKIDGVFHLAAQASVPFSIANLYASSSTNLSSTLKIIEYCSRRRISLVYASSSAVYGNLPLGGECGEVDLLSPYSADKYVAEIYSRIAHTLYGLRSYGLRFFNVYGPRQDPINPYSGVISIFADRVLKGLPITINGGYQTRDFIYVTDVVRGLWNSYQYLLENDVATYSNLLTGKSITIDDLADTLMLLGGNAVGRRYQMLPPGDPVKSLGTVARMHDHLKLGQFVQIVDGLKQVLAWMKAAQ